MNPEHIPEVSKSTPLGGKTKFIFIGVKYDTKEEAEKAREEAILQATQNMEQNAEKKLALDKMQILLKERSSEYEKAPEYLTYYVYATHKTPKQETWFGLFKEESAQGVSVNLEDLSEKIGNACKEISIRGYSVFSITPINGGFGFTYNNLPGGMAYTVTEGAIVVGKRLKNISLP